MTPGGGASSSRSSTNGDELCDLGQEALVDLCDTFPVRQPGQVLAAIDTDRERVDDHSLSGPGPLVCQTEAVQIGRARMYGELIGKPLGLHAETVGTSVDVRRGHSSGQKGLPD